MTNQLDTVQLYYKTHSSYPKTSFWHVSAHVWYIAEKYYSKTEWMTLFQISLMC